MQNTGFADELFNKGTFKKKEKPSAETGAKKPQMQRSPGTI